MADSITPNSVLQRQPNLELKLLPGSTLEVKLKEGWVTVHHANSLAVLDVFTVPRTLKDGLALLQRQASGRQDWLEISQAVLGMTRMGILSVPGESKKVRSKRGFDQAAVHIAMLNDEARTAGYIEAIHNTVQPGDVVVDLGTGTGVLATAAAQAGARRVFAIESGRIGLSAKRVFVANGVEDRVKLLQGWSTKLDLPEPADLMVSEILGNNPFGEKILEYTLDARRRFLRPKARLIPARLKVFATLVAGAGKHLSTRHFCKESIKKWEGCYGVDFSPLLSGAPKLRRFALSAEDCRSLERGPDSLLIDLDLSTFEELIVESKTILKAGDGGPYDGLMISFEAELTSEISLSTHPARANSSCHWHNQLWAFAEDSTVPSEGTLQISYTYGGSGPQLQILDQADRNSDL